MAQQIIVRTTDDLLGDGTEADETVKFAIDGIAYEIDLTAKNAAEMRAFLDKYRAAARKEGRVAKPRSSTPQSPNKWSTGPTSSAANKEHNAAIREWARQHGVEINDRGRIAQPVVDAYAAQDPRKLPGYTEKLETVQPAKKSAQAAVADPFKTEEPRTRTRRAPTATKSLPAQKSTRAKGATTAA